MPPRITQPTSVLLAEYAAPVIAPGARALLLGSDDPALGHWLADTVGTSGQAIAYPATYTAQQVLTRIPGLDVRDSVYPPVPDPDAPARADADETVLSRATRVASAAAQADRVALADVALIIVPKGRDRARACLWTAAHAVQPGGVIFLAGPNAGGSKSAIKDAEGLFGAAPVLGYKASHRVARATRPEALHLPPDWGTPWLAEARTVTRPEGDYTLVTQPGVFSWQQVDAGTALLLDQFADGITIASGNTVLDLGCGSGIIGLAAARAGARATLVDNDLLAVRCARESVAANDLAHRCTVVPGDVTGPVRARRFDWVLSNPPFHEGVEVSLQVARRIVREAHDCLRPGGRLVIVANRFLPYPPEIEATFGAVETLADTERYTVWQGTRAR